MSEVPLYAGSSPEISKSERGRSYSWWSPFWRLCALSSHVLSIFRKFVKIEEMSITRKGS